MPLPPALPEGHGGMPDGLSRRDAAFADPCLPLLSRRARGRPVTFPGLLLWTGGLGIISLLGSLSARKYSRGTLLIAMLCVLAASAQLLPGAPVVLLAGHGWYAAPGIIPLALSLVAICAGVEKFGQVEGHRAALFATATQALALIVPAGARRSPPPPLTPSA